MDVESFYGVFSRKLTHACHQIRMTDELLHGVSQSLRILDGHKKAVFPLDDAVLR